jgi:hypothetical protein
MKLVIPAKFPANDKPIRINRVIGGDGVLFAAAILPKLLNVLPMG